MEKSVGHPILTLFCELDRSKLRVVQSGCMTSALFLTLGEKGEGISLLFIFACRSIDDNPKKALRVEIPQWGSHSSWTF